MPATKKNIHSKYRNKWPPTELALNVTRKTSYKKLLANFQEMLKYEKDDPEDEHFLQDIIYEKFITDIATKKFKTNEKLQDMSSKIYNLVLKPSDKRSRWFA
jgi:ABC-type branched-subunit amino acid transport system substrate-binding protein